MSAFNALINAVTGLAAQSTALENISGNIANSQTIGYKRVETSFAEMVAGAEAGQQRAGSVATYSRGTNTIGGAPTTTGISTNFALKGDGFVVVRQPADDGSGQTTFSRTNLFTRRGDFALDENGYLVNGTGQYLCGFSIDTVTGARATTAPEVIRVAVGLAPARGTTTVAYNANLPSTANTQAFSSRTSTTDVWTAVAGTAPITITPSGTPSASDFAQNSISGQSVRMYDSLGSPKDVDLRWVKIDHSAATGANTWALYYNKAPGSDAAHSSWERVTTAQFNASGTMTSPATAPVLDLSGIGLGSSVAFDITAGKVTQFSDDVGDVQVGRVVQDGYSAGKLQTIAVEESGRVTASFSNGQTRDIAQIAVAQFSAPNDLAIAGTGTWRESSSSGSPMLRTDGVTFVGGSVEGSNTDVAEEFSKLIVAQQAYSANTRVMSTVQQMLQDVLSAVR